MPLPTPTLSQEAKPLDLQWNQGDASFDQSLVVRGEDWTGTYKAEIRAGPNTTFRLLATLNVTATHSGAADSDTTIRFQLADTTLVPHGGWYDCRQVGVRTRFAGRVIVKQGVTE